MTEKIVYTPGKITAPPSTLKGKAAEHATHSRAFATFLAEAEAVRDVVRLNSPVVPASHGMRGGLQAALHGMAGLLLGPLPRLMMQLRGKKPPGYR